MTVIKVFKMLLLLCTVFFTSAQCVYATCTSAYQLQNYTMALKGGAIYVPLGAAVGSVIYTQRFTVSNSYVSVTCSSATTGNYFDFYSNPLTEAPGFDRVFATTVPGIGVRFHFDNQSVTAPIGPYGDPVPKLIWGWYPTTSQVTMTLIKTENVTGTGVIQGNTLPAVQFRFIGTPVWRISLGGSMTFNAATCDIAVPNTTVQMGSHDLSVFTGASQASEWRDASIIMNNCGRFNGRTEPTAIPTFDANADTYTNSALIDNIVSVTLQPQDGIANAAEGIFNIIPVVEGRLPSATGVGIQLSATQSAAGIVNLASPLKMNLPRDGRSVITIPLYARYIKTENTIVPGLANGRITYVINYQ